MPLVVLNKMIQAGHDPIPLSHGLIRAQYGLIRALQGLLQAHNGPKSASTCVYISEQHAAIHAHTRVYAKPKPQAQTYTCPKAQATDKHIHKCTGI